MGLVTEGEFAGDYVVSGSDFDAVKDDYVLDAHKSAEAPAAKAIKKDIKVYVPCSDEAVLTDAAGTPVGINNY